MVELPPDCPVASPIGSTVATVGSDELQVTTFDSGCVVRSENVPVAENPRTLPGAICAVEGFTLIDVSVAELTVREVLPVMPPKAAMIVAGPEVRA